jgi:DNA topoisomerase-1
MPPPTTNSRSANSHAAEGGEAPGYRRCGSTGAFCYEDEDGRRIRDAGVLERIHGIVIPPAWTDVWINPDPAGRLQATGRDARGRKQYRYHVVFRARCEQKKFAYLVEFGRVLPRLRRAVRAGLDARALRREKVCALAVRLLETSCIRIGNDEYVRANGSYGLTTLRKRHVQVRGARIHFDFVGKSGIHHQVRRLQELPGRSLLKFVDVDGTIRRLQSDDVNAFIRSATQADHTARQFRTWAATVLAVREFSLLPPPLSLNKARRAAMAVFRSVARRLGNTPSVCRKSYVHPAVLAGFSAGTLPPLTRTAAQASHAPRGDRLSTVESYLLRLLQGGGFGETSRAGEMAAAR